MIQLQIKSDTQGNDLDIVKSAIAAEIKRLEIGLHRTERFIAEKENKYGVASDIFLREFSAEDLESGDQEYVEWAGELKILQRITDDLQKLKSISYVAQ